MTNDKLKINRFGLLVSTGVSANQCKTLNHTHYEYHVAVTCGSKLDKEGFVINHTDIDRVIQEAFHAGMDSCEVLLIRIINAVEAVMKKHRVEVFAIYGKLAPILIVASKEYAYMEITREF